MRDNGVSPRTKRRMSPDELDTGSWIIEVSRDRVRLHDIDAPDLSFR